MATQREKKDVKLCQNVPFRIHFPRHYWHVSAQNDIFHLKNLCAKMCQNVAKNGFCAAGSYRHVPVACFDLFQFVPDCVQYIPKSLNSLSAIAFQNVPKCAKNVFKPFSFYLFFSKCRSDFNISDPMRMNQVAALFWSKESDSSGKKLLIKFLQVRLFFFQNQEDNELEDERYLVSSRKRFLTLWACHPPAPFDFPNSRR